ncbi:MAG: class 1 fructose-bisphosphatase [Candidatus Accumulibacter sp.]|jgi:fructose-1,6-bisphosphatase|nr:class 1 fructose-bisphosphatase [Accumulibacter sp.]
MRFGRTNINKYLVGEQRLNPAIAGDFSMLISDVVRSCKAISQVVSLGRLIPREGDVATVDRHGGSPTDMKDMARRIFLHHCEWGGHLAAISPSEMETTMPPPEERKGRYLLLFDALDGSSNIDINLTVGSIFSVLRRPEREGEATVEDFLQAGSAQVAAGYALYGSSTILVLTIGKGTHGFTLDREIGEFLLTHPYLAIPPETRYFAINTSRERFWEPPIQRYVQECLDGQAGIRGKDFDMRWAAAMVANVHRILMRGGVFLNPRDSRDPDVPGRVGLLHKANPMAMLVEQAGGMASTGYGRVADIVPARLHQPTPVILGSRAEIERIERYHAEYLSGEDRPFSSPLFGTRSLFRADEGREA